MFIWSILLSACITGIVPLTLHQDKIVNVTIDETIVNPGRESIVVLRVKIKEGFHIQANQVTNASLIPVTLRVTPQKHFITGKAVFPPWKLFQLEGTEEFLQVFDSTFNIQLPVKTTAATKEGRYTIEARLHYQACNNRTCLFPRTLSFRIPVLVVP